MTMQTTGGQLQGEDGEPITDFCMRCHEWVELPHDCDEDEDDAA